MGDMPGFGDASTWGPVLRPNDPRRNDVADDKLEAALCRAADHIEFHFGLMSEALDKGNLQTAVAEFNKIMEAQL